MTPPGTDADAHPPNASPTKKVPCWVCGGDLTFNYVSLTDRTVTIHNYCARCKRPRKITMTVD